MLGNYFKKVELIKPHNAGKSGKKRIICKTYNMREMSNLYSMLPEVSFASYYSHPHMCKIGPAYFVPDEDSDKTAFLPDLVCYEEYGGMSLRDLSNALTRAERIFYFDPIFFPIVCLCFHMNFKGWSHRDLKLENICIRCSVPGDNVDYPNTESSIRDLSINNVFLIDFGKVTNHRLMDTKDCYPNNCTITNEAPEFLFDPKNCSLQHNTDIYSLAVAMIHFLRAGKWPKLSSFDVDHNLGEKLQILMSSGQSWALHELMPATIYNELSDSLINLLEGMLQLNYNNRFSWLQLYHHPLFHHQTSNHQDHQLQENSVPPLTHLSPSIPLTEYRAFMTEIFTDLLRLHGLFTGKDMCIFVHVILLYHWARKTLYSDDRVISKNHRKLFHSLLFLFTETNCGVLYTPLDGILKKENDLCLHLLLHMPPGILYPWSLGKEEIGTILNEFLKLKKDRQRKRKTHL